MEIAYRCMGESIHSFKVESNRSDGIRCPICQRPVMPMGFSDEEYDQLPEYENLRKQSKDSEREIELKRLASIKRSGSFTSINRDGPGQLVNSVLKEDFDWLVEQLEKRINKDI